MIREMQIKTTVRYHLRAVGQAIIKNRQNAGEGMEKNGIPLHCSWGCKILWRFLKKLKVELPYDPTFPLQSTYPNKNYNSKRYKHQFRMAE